MKEDKTQEPNNNEPDEKQLPPLKKALYFSVIAASIAIIYLVIYFVTNCECHCG